MFELTRLDCIIVGNKYGFSMETDLKKPCTVVTGGYYYYNCCHECGLCGTVGHYSRVNRLWCNSGH